MSCQNIPDERVVYLALKNVFIGTRAEVRQPKTIRKLIDQSKSEGNDVSYLTNSHNIDRICHVARTLLTEQIFGSTLKAKIRFPEIFDVSPAQSAERAASVAEAARNEASAIRDAVHTKPEQPEQRRDDNKIAKAQTLDSVETRREYVQPKELAARRMASLFPAYIPLGTQHRLLCKVQTMLEKACFEFARRSMPEILKGRDWDCPEAAELHLWAKELLERHSHFANKQEAVGKPFEEILRSAADIRHAAVHRLRLSARGLEQFILDAESLATLLCDDSCIKSLTKLRRETLLVIEELERNKHVLSSNLDETRKRIAARRAELERLGEVAMKDLEKEDGEYQSLAGFSLDRVLQIFESPKPLDAATQCDQSLDLDDTDSIDGCDEKALSPFQ